MNHGKDLNHLTRMLTRLLFFRPAFRVLKFRSKLFIDNQYVTKV